MTTPARSSVVMSAARLMAGRNPIASAVLVMGHQKVHAAEFLDGESVLIFQSGLRKRSVIRGGKVIESGESSFIGCELVRERMDSIIARLTAQGYFTKVKEVQQVTLPLLPMERVAQVA